MKAKIKYHDGASRIERHGAMWDMAASETVTLRKGEVRIIPLGVSVKLPSGFMGVLVPRSSTCLKHGIMMANSVGIIENDYAGNNDMWGFVAYAIRDTVIEQGTRIAQFMPVRYAEDIEFEEVDSMGCADRGGYGSTGVSAGSGAKQHASLLLQKLRRLWAFPASGRAAASEAESRGREGSRAC